MNKAERTYDFKNSDLGESKNRIVDVIGNV